MNILAIYKKYQIMPQLAEHQLRVAAVAEMICQSFDGKISHGDIVAACLLHDMGNILKFDLAKSNSLLHLDINVNFWQKVKDVYKQKYGLDEHQASLKIAKDLGVGGRIVELVDAVGFEVALENEQGSDFGKKICEYADDRVSPNGVVGLEQRFIDLRIRYAHRHQDWGSEQKRQSFETALRKIERQIFEHCNIKPEDITEQSIKGLKKGLENFEISTVAA